VSIIQEKRKNRQREILKTTFELFSTLGYKAVNLDKVAEHAGCSKSTIYQLFGNKEGLISALSVDVVSELAKNLDDLSLGELSITDSLNTFAHQILKLILSDNHIAVVRTIFADSWTFPELGITYYQMGPVEAQKAFTKYLENQVSRAVLNISDCSQASRHFFGLLLWDKMIPMILGAQKMMTPAQVEQHVAWCVKTFLITYPPISEH
jgi:Transcriptional regulator